MLLYIILSPKDLIELLDKGFRIRSFSRNAIHLRSRRFVISGPFTHFHIGFVPFLPVHDSGQLHLLLAEHSPRSCTRWSYTFELAAMVFLIALLLIGWIEFKLTFKF
ncbi:hypothetical protein V8E53_002486 [Lactarius tabidus]